MSSAPTASSELPSNELGIFNQIALFSVGGLAMSMASIFVGGVRIIYPWF